MSRKGDKRIRRVLQPRVCKFIKHKPFMVLYLINEATDAKRQPRLAITEPRVWQNHFVILQWWSVLAHS
ncbi:hypothetical protein B7990_08825 [Fibrobacter sp. UWB4]|nr:hypothetical protein B7990_08825 [Fibrobacter sp. UWB4]